MGEGGRSGTGGVVGTPQDAAGGALSRLTIGQGNKEVSSRGGDCDNCDGSSLACDVVFERPKGEGEVGLGKDRANEPGKCGVGPLTRGDSRDKLAKEVVGDVRSCEGNVLGGRSYRDGGLDGEARDDGRGGGGMIFESAVPNEV